MRSIRFQRGFWNFVIPAIASVAGSLIGKSAQKDTNEENAALARETMAFNAEEALKTRAWSAEQADQQRDFNSVEANQSRIFNASEAALNRSFLSQEAGTTRDFNSAEASVNRLFQAQEADRARAWSERMSATSYQRAIGDLERAGLNPMLAYSQGGAPMPTAGTPSGSMASGSNPGGSAASSGMASSGIPGGASASSSGFHRRDNATLAGISTALAGAQLSNVIKQGTNIDADTALKHAQANRETSSAANLNAGTEKIITGEIPKVRAELNLLQSQNITEFGRARLVEAQGLLTKIDAELRAGQIQQVDAQTALSRVEAQLKRLEIPQAEAYSEKFKSEWGKEVSPYLKEVVDILRALIYGRSATR